MSPSTTRTTTPAEVAAGGAPTVRPSPRRQRTRRAWVGTPPVACIPQGRPSPRRRPPRWTERGGDRDSVADGQTPQDPAGVGRVEAAGGCRCRRSEVSGQSRLIMCGSQIATPADCHELKWPVVVRVCAGPWLQIALHHRGVNGMVLPLGVMGLTGGLGGSPSSRWRTTQMNASLIFMMLIVSLWRRGTISGVCVYWARQQWILGLVPTREGRARTHVGQLLLFRGPAPPTPRAAPSQIWVSRRVVWTPSGRHRSAPRAVT